MAVKVPWVSLAVVLVHGVCILQDDVHCGVEFQSVYRVGNGRIRVICNTVDVISCEVVAFWWRVLVEQVMRIPCRRNKHFYKRNNLR